MWNNLYYTPARAQQVDFVTYLLAATGGMVRKAIRSTSTPWPIRAASARRGLGTVEEASLRDTSENVWQPQAADPNLHLPR